jgi:hypothetical protein
MTLLQPKLDQQSVKQLVIEPQSVRDLVCFDEDHPRFRGVLVSQVLEERGEGGIIQVTFAAELRLH